jgi:hypothetical protein
MNSDSRYVDHYVLSKTTWCLQTLAAISVTVTGDSETVANVSLYFTFELTMCLLYVLM